MPGEAVEFERDGVRVSGYLARPAGTPREQATGRPRAQRVGAGRASASQPAITAWPRAFGWQRSRER